MTDSLLRFELRGPVAMIQMDDGKANVLSHAMIDALSAAFDRATREAKVVVLAGRPGRFSAGFDLNVMKSGADAAIGLLLAGGSLMMRVYEHAQPVVCAVTGHAIAGGSLLAACCDERVGIRGDFKLGLNELAAGMSVPILAHELARDRLDPRALQRAVLGAQLFDPEAAVRVGWLDRVVEPAALEAAALEIGEQLAKLSGPAFAATKRSLRARTIEYVRATLEEDVRSFGARLAAAG